MIHRSSLFRGFCYAVVGMMILALWVALQDNELVGSSFTTGYLLLTAILLLAGYNLRKRVPQLPLGTSQVWMQVHIWMGLGTAWIFFLHVGWRWPTGWLESSLAVCYWLTFLSGVWGLYLTWTVPAQLARVGEEIIYERIPRFRFQIRQQARQLVLQSVTTSGTTTVADFYTTRLYDFFERPRSWGYLIRPTSKLRKSLMHEMQNLRRYLSQSDQQLLEQLFALVRKKDDLDFHAARQGLLKRWLFVHIALTYMLLSLAVLHGVTAHVFWGGAL